MLLVRNIHFGKASGRCRVHGGDYFIEMQTHKRPLLVAEDNERKLPARKVLLVSDVLVGAEQHFVPGFLCLLKEFSVLKFMPANPLEFSSAELLSESWAPSQGSGWRTAERLLLPLVSRRRLP